MMAQVDNIWTQWSAFSVTKKGTARMGQHASDLLQ